MTVKQRVVVGIGLVGFVVGVWILGASTAQALGALPSPTRTAVIGFVAVVLVPVITYFTTRSLQQRRARDDAIREKRTEFYDKIIRGLIKNLGIDTTVDKPTPEQQLKFFADITPELVLYASRRVVLAWNQFRRVGQSNGPANVAILFAFEYLLREMRRDLGHSVPSGRNFEVLRMFVNDIDTLLPQRQRRRPPSASE